VNKRTLSEKVSDEIEKKDEDEVDSYGQLLIEVRRFVASCPSHWRLGMYEETPMTAVVYQSAFTMSKQGLENLDFTECTGDGSGIYYTKMKYCGRC